MHVMLRAVLYSSYSSCSTWDTTYVYIYAFSQELTAAIAIVIIALHHVLALFQEKPSRFLEG